jgi:hypothetical protein
MGWLGASMIDDAGMLTVEDVGHNPGGRLSLDIHRGNDDAEAKDFAVPFDRRIKVRYG